jgi:AraC-like DNA-binding protein
MDILADQLAQARARGAIFSVLRRIRPWGLRFGGQRLLTAHCLVDGEGWLEQPGREPVRLRERDMVLMTAGPPYAIVSDPGTAAVPIADARRQGTDAAPGDAATILCGAYVLEGSVAVSLLGTLPRAVIVTAGDQEPAHAAVMALLADQISRDVPGQQTLLDRLLDLNLVFALRSWWSMAGAAAPGWYRALSEPGLRRVLEHVHSAPEADWTVPVLADLAGLSRASFAARFRQVTGQSPGAYVTDVRMQRAEDELTRSDATLAQIAAAVGYRNEYAFATAFRRRHAVAPGKWRTRAREPGQTSDLFLAPGTATGRVSRRPGRVCGTGQARNLWRA